MATSELKYDTNMPTISDEVIKGTRASKWNPQNVMETWNPHSY